MRNSIYFLFMYLVGLTSGFSQQQTKIFVLLKNDYVVLENKNDLINEAIKNAFGEASKENYKFEITQVTAWNSLVKEFKYYPEEGDKRSVLKTKVVQYSDNYDLNFKVTIDKNKSQIPKSIRPFLDKKNAFLLNVVVVGAANFFIADVKTKEKYFKLIDENKFTDKVFEVNFGANPEQKNYHIAFDKVKARVMKDLFNLSPVEEFQLMGVNNNYSAFAEKITSPEYKSGYVQFEIPLNRQASRLTPKIEQVVFKTEKGEEFLKFYFCIPADNAKENSVKEVKTEVKTVKKSTSLGAIKGIMVSVNSKINPISNQKVELRSSQNDLLQVKQTDNSGRFEFNNIDLDLFYLIELPEYINEDENSRIYLTNNNNELVKEFVKNNNNTFVYKTINADVFRLCTMNEEDVELTFLNQKKANKSMITIEDFIYYDLNSSEILPDSKPILEKIVNILKENSDYSLEIISHTDSRGENEANQKLSIKRSQTVFDYIQSMNNVDTKRLKPIGMGETQPLNSCINGRNCIEDEYKMNRRTEFLFKRG